MNLSPNFLITLLIQNGFVLVRAKGSHQIFRNPITGKTIIVPVHGGKDMKKGTLLRIIKQAGIDKSAINRYYFGR